MALFIAELENFDESVDRLLVSSVSKEMAEKTLKALYPSRQITIAQDDPVLVEQEFNEQYGGIALLGVV